jgi:hypothetical protein
MCAEFCPMLISWNFGLIACCLDRGLTATQARSKKRMEQWILDQEKKRSKEFLSEIDELDKEAHRLADRLEEHMKDKRKRDFEIRLLKGEFEKRKTYPRGVPPGPSPEEHREQRERDTEKAWKDAEHRLKCKQREENTPLMVYQRESRANLAIDRDYYRKLEAAKSPPPQVLGRIVLTPEMQHRRSPGSYHHK